MMFEYYNYFKKDFFIFFIVTLIIPVLILLISITFKIKDINYLMYIFPFYIPFSIFMFYKMRNKFSKLKRDGLLHTNNIKNSDIDFNNEYTNTIQYTLVHKIVYYLLPYVFIPLILLSFEIIDSIHLLFKIFCGIILITWVLLEIPKISIRFKMNFNPQYAYVSLNPYKKLRLNHYALQLNDDEISKYPFLKLLYYLYVYITYISLTLVFGFILLLLIILIITSIFNEIG